jgi:hypothetical protein
MDNSVGDGTAPGAEALELSHTTRQIEALLTEADRIMMQIVQVSLSLIGFGFTINAFFNDFAARSGGSVGSRRVGIAMLTLGLCYLAGGIGGQWTFRRRARRRLKTLYRAAHPGDGLRRPIAPAFTLAIALLAVSVAALAMALLREIP